MGVLNSGGQGERQTEEEKVNKIKQTLKRIGKTVARHWKLFFILLIVAVVAILFFAMAAYIIKKIDATEDSGSSSNVPSSVSSYTSSYSVNDSGTIEMDSSIQELWDEMIENGCNIDDYLDSAEELAWLVNAGLITQYVDTREDPDEEIDWETIIAKMAGESSSDEDSDESDDESEENDEEDTEEEESSSDSNYTYITLSDFTVYTEETENDELIIDDLSDLKTAFEGAKGAGTSNLVQYAETFLECQEEYKVNAIFAAAVTINECGAGTNCQIGGYNWFSIKSDSGWRSYSSPEDAIEDFYDLIANGNYYFTQEKYTVTDIGMTYCTNADADGGWIENVTSYMQNMYEALGIHVTITGTATKTVQGIIKFKRVTSDDTEGTTMSYVDIETFYDWIEIYNETGDEETKENLMTHFTLETETTSTSSSSSSSDRYNVTLNYSESDQWTDISAQIVKAAFQVSSPGSGLCQSWVRQVYAKAGLGQGYYDTAYAAYKANCVSTSTENIPVGAAVYGTGSASNSCGHVGIYLGDIDGDGTGEVIENINGNIEINDLDYWISWQTNAGASIPGEGAGWLGWGWQSSEPTRILSEEETEEAIKSIAGSYTNGTISYSESSSSSSSSSSSDSTSSTSSTSSDTEETEDESETETKTYAIVATWSTTEYKETVDPEDTEAEQEEDYTTYSVSTTKVDYQNLTAGYTMPFNYLYELLVYSEDKDFVLDLAKLVYESEIEITVYDNEVTVEEEEIIVYDKYKEVTTTGEGTVTYNDGSITTKIDDINETVESDAKVEDITHTYWTKTTTNTLNVALTLADVWMAKYEVTVTLGDTTTNSSGTTDGGDHEITLLDDIDYSSLETKNENTIRSPWDASYPSDQGYDVNIDFSHETKCEVQNIRQTTETTTKTTSFTKSSTVVTEKTDKDSEEDNFVTLFIKYTEARRAILEWWDSLLEVMETNDDTEAYVDLTKYLVYKATGRDYGVTEFDFEEFIALYGYSTSGTSGLYGDTVEEQVWWALIDAGYSKIATAAVMGNIYAESGFDSTAIEGGTGIGLGLCQWSYGRRTQLEGYIAYKGTDTSDVQTQIEFLIAELTPGGGANGYATYQIGGSSSSKYDGHSYTASDWQNATDIDTATVAFMALFERPSYDSSKNHLSRRQEKALEYYNTYKDAEKPSYSSAEATITSVSGDGYSQTVTINGKTYNEYKQSRGSYKSNTYSGGTISSSGCGPTSSAIVASGYGSTYNPGTLVSAAKTKYGVSNFTASPSATSKMLTTAGLTYTTDYTLSKADLVTHLESGRPAVLSVDSSCNSLFTGNTHYIAILGINGDEVYVSNPNPSKATGWISIDKVITCNSSSSRVAFLITNY